MIKKIFGKITGGEMRQVKDNGTRVAYGGGAMKEASSGKGRMDLIPMDIIVDIMEHDNGRLNDNGFQQDITPIDILKRFSEFQRTGEPIAIMEAVNIFMILNEWTFPVFLSELSKQFEAGEKKYPATQKNGKFQLNAQRGLPANRLFDSGARHFNQWLNSETDEPHDSAFCWNMVMLLWYIKYKPETNNIFHEGFTGALL